MSELEWLEIFSSNLRELIEEKKITQKELAIMSGLSEGAISYYVHGQKIPSIRAIINIAYAIEISINELIDFGDVIV